jgi:hypothetical protein
LVSETSLNSNVYPVGYKRVKRRMKQSSASTTPSRADATPKK